MIKEIRPICILRQFGKVLELHINSFKNGHRMLYWYKAGNREHTQHQQLYKADVRLDDFTDEGYYYFYTANQKGERSARIKAYILYENTTDQIRSILSCAPSELPDKKLGASVMTRLQSDLAHQADQRISALIGHYLDQDKNNVSQVRNSYYQLAYAAERYENQQNKTWNTTISEPISIRYSGNGILETNGFITDVAIEQEDGRTLRHLKTYTKTEIPLGIANPGVYYINLYIDSDLVNRFVFIRFDEELTANKWQEDWKAADRQEKIENERLDNVTASSLTLTNSERNTYSTEVQLNPQYPVIPRIKVEPIDGSESVNIHIYNYGLLQALGRRFSLCVKENDMLFTNYFDNEELLRSEDFDYQCAANFIADDCYFFIRDEKDTILNRLAMHSSTTDLASFREKIRQIEVETYQKRMLPFIEYRVSGYSTLLSQFLHSSLTESDTPAEDIWLRLLEHVLYDEVAINKNEVAAAIVEEYNCTQVYETEFFTPPVTYSYSEDKLIFPPKEDHYALVVHSVDYGERDFETEYIPSDNGAIEVSLKDKSKYIIYAVDAKTYHVSGAFYINMEQGEKAMRQYNINLEVR